MDRGASNGCGHGAIIAGEGPEGSAFSFSGLKVPLKIPAVGTAADLAASTLLSRIIDKAQQYGAQEAVLFCKRPTVFAYFDGRSEPLRYDSNWSDVCFLAERHPISIYKDRAAISVVGVRDLNRFLPNLGAGSFSDYNPDLDPKAILLLVKEKR